MPISSQQNFSRNGTWQTYGVGQGLDLLDLQLEHIVEDGSGCLWFGTFENGVLRFDGDTFERFTRQDGLCGQIVHALAVDHSDRLWVGTWDGGLCWWDGQDFRRPEGDESVFGKGISYLFVDSVGRVWFCGPGRIGYIEGVRVHQLASPESDYSALAGKCWGIVEDDAGRIWFGCHDFRGIGRLLQYYEGKLSCVEQGESSYTVCRDGAGRIWVGLHNEIRYLEGDNFKAAARIQGHLVRKLQADRSGRIWVCTEGAGVHWWDGRGLQAFTSGDGLAYDGVNGMHEDRQGLFWFATFGGGISCYDPKARRYTKGAPLRHNEVSNLGQDQEGSLWIGFSTRGGSSPGTESVGFLSENRFSVAPVEGGLWTSGCRALCVGQEGRMWFGFHKGLFYWDGQHLRPAETAEGFNGVVKDFFISALATNGQGQLFFNKGSFDGRVRLMCYDGSACRQVFGLSLKEDLHLTKILPQQDGGFWLAINGVAAPSGNEGGIIHLDAEGVVTRYTAVDGLADNRVEDLLEDRKGRLWLATRNGLSCFAAGNFSTFTKADGLPSDHILCLFEDRLGRLWLGTASGPVCYNGVFFQQINSPAIGPTHAILQRPDGSFWFGTSAGVVSYEPGEVPPRMLQVEVAGKTDDGEGMIETADQQVAFEFKGASFRTRPDGLLYTWRLRPLEEQWQGPSSALRVVYQDLALGEYCFEVRAIDQDLNSSEPIAAQLRVVPDPKIEALNRAFDGGVNTEFVGHSQALRRVQADLAQVGVTEETVLILGETGTGKGLAARTVHNLSPRSKGPYIQVNCGAIPQGLVESELFGHEKGAFSGAHARKVGRVELAKGGTLFLDEIGDMPLEAQVKLLRLLEERTFERVGGTQTLEVQVRVIAATNRNLRQLVQEDQFRADLYYRLQGFEVQLPPLRQRREDIPLLAAYFAEKMAAHLNKELGGLRPEAEAKLRAYAWPGNVRELEHAVRRAVIVCQSGEIRDEDLVLDAAEETALVETRLTPEAYERQYYQKALEQTGWVVKGPKGAAELLGLPVSTLNYRIKKLGLHRS